MVTKQKTATTVRLTHTCGKCGHAADLHIEIQAVASATAGAAPRLLASDEQEPAYWAVRMYDRHPKKRGKVLVEHWVCRQFAEYASGAFSCRLREIDRVHALWCSTEDWQKENGRWAPQLAEWLADEGWKREPICIEPVRKKSRAELEMDAI